MIFLDDHLQKIVTLKMYRTNELWYARVGNVPALINNIETPSICAAERDINGDRVLYPQAITSSTDTTNNNIINIVLKDNTGQTQYPDHQENIQQDTPQIHSSMAWSNFPPIAECCDTFLESNSDCMDYSSITTDSTDTTIISIFITTQPLVNTKTPTNSNLNRLKPKNTNRRYYIHGEKYKPKSTAAQQEFQRVINDTLDTF